MFRKATGRRWNVGATVHKRFRSGRAAARIEHMFEVAPDYRQVSGCAEPTATAELQDWIELLADLDDEVSDAERIDQLRALEELKAAAAAAQARVTASLDTSLRAERAARGVPAPERARGIGAQVALARRDSPHRGGRHLGFARALVHEMPHTLVALSSGRISEWRATLLVRETACLSREDRSRVDEALAGDLSTLDGLGDRALTAAARRLAYQLDPEAALRRVRGAEQDRRVTLRPAPDTMSLLTGLLPVAQGVAAMAALTQEADRARAAGDSRSRGQVMADTLVERVTGQATASATPVTVNLVMTERALLEGDDEPAEVLGYGPVPAGTGRDLLRRHTETDDPVARTWLRRLFTHPGTDELVAMQTKAEVFPAALRQLLVFRDQTCRTPWCDAPVRHADHARRRADGGETSAGNGQGLCEHCNYVKEAERWAAAEHATSRLGSHVVETVTPTGHRYRSRPPPQPGAPDHLTDGRIRPLGAIDVLFSDHLRRLDAA